MHSIYLRKKNQKYSISLHQMKSIKDIYSLDLLIRIFLKCLVEHTIMFTNLVRTKVNIIPPANGSKYYSARIYLEEHYANAVSNYEKGNIIRAFHQLGMACHYLADCGTPPHTAGIQFPLNPLAPNPHHVFEKYVDKHCDEYNATSAIGLYGSLDDAKLGYTVNYMAKKSSSYKDVVLSMDPLQYPKALPVSLGISQQYTAVLLEKFYRKVSSK